MKLNIQTVIVPPYCWARLWFCAAKLPLTVKVPAVEHRKRFDFTVVTAKNVENVPD